MKFTVVGNTFVIDSELKPEEFSALEANQALTLNDGVEDIFRISLGDEARVDYDCVVFDEVNQLTGTAIIQIELSFDDSAMSYEDRRQALVREFVVPLHRLKQLEGHIHTMAGMIDDTVEELDGQIQFM